MNANELPEIPQELTAYAEEIKATTRETINLKLTPSTTLTPWQSKVGGEPYLPLTEEYPCNPEGVPLMLLAQINFSEMPCLPNFPEKGILQFYVDGSDELIGMNLSDLVTQDGFRILYFEEVYEDRSKLHRNANRCQEREYGPFQDDTACRIEFSQGKQYITWTDYRFQLMPFSKDYGLVDDSYSKLSETGHRIGGYPCFTQEDPRKGKYEEYELLFQLDSEYGYGHSVDIMWGDSGVGAFFIRPDDLKKRVFTDVLYSWDCC
jgi:uncharacterized protein YwqG